MDGILNVNIYGDSLMRATVVDEAFRYHTLMRQFTQRMWESLKVQIRNKAHFGYTADRGYAVLQKDKDKGFECRFALVEFGGNDCNFDWQAISEAPEAEHGPKVPLGQFVETMDKMTDTLLAAGVEPILMTLPPLDAERYFDCIGRTVERMDNVLKWLGDKQVIYRFQEMYSAAIQKLAMRKGLEIVDIRSYFLDKRDYRDFIARDGIHLTEKGYDLIYTAFCDFLREKGVTPQTPATLSV